MASTVYDPMDRAGLEFWLHTQAGNNSERRRRLLRNLPKAVAAELTPASGRSWRCTWRGI